MADLSTEGRERAQSQSHFMLLPVATDGSSVSLATSQRFGPFAAGDSLVVSLTAPAHVVAGDSAVAATTARPLFPAGAHKLVVPNACTHVAMIQSAAGAASGIAYEG